MRENSQTNMSSDFNTEWRGMAQDVLKHSELSDHPALSRLQAHAQENSNGSMDIGCYSRMHHRHNR
ncbi:MAG: hypothetical protein K2Y18_10245 [Alphaproteobacteria bacterium]|jgi:hypothetical protein|nr:hypothetical protein [Alphaproteobacteria bacterium]